LAEGQSCRDRAPGRTELDLDHSLDSGDWPEGSKIDEGMIASPRAWRLPKPELFGNGEVIIRFGIKKPSKMQLKYH
jgi:hypothetical protein